MASNERRKLNYAIGCLLFVMMMCLVGSARVITWYQRMTDCHDGRSPLRGFKITIDISQNQQLIEQLNKFADEYDFKFGVNKYTPDGEDFLIQLTRKDTEVIVTNTPFAQGEFDVWFLNNDCAHPTIASDIDNLVYGLKSFISEIPNATIADE